MSQWLAHDAAIGTAMSLLGPSGDCSYVPGREEQPLLLAGTGTGWRRSTASHVTPVRPLTTGRFTSCTVFLAGAALNDIHADAFVPSA